MNNIIIFTDLDGTLLDADNYSFSAAQGAIDMLIERKIPIICCTSKTHLEVIETQKSLGISDPFIVENGSAIFFTKGYFTNIELPLRELDEYQFLMLGSEYKEVLNFFDDWKSQHKLSVTGIHEMAVEQIIGLTDLNYNEAELAQKRFFSEPFILNNDRTLPDSAIDDIINNGYRLLQGNRFYHLLGNSDKGAAVRRLSELFKQKWNVDKLITVGIGDSMNDLEMLKFVTKPALVKKPSGNHEERIKIDNLLHTKGVGPAGWQEAVFKLIEL